MASASSETLDAIASRARALSVACDSPRRPRRRDLRERLDAIDALRDAVVDRDGSTTERADEALRAGEDALATCVVEPAGSPRAARDDDAVRVLSSDGGGIDVARDPSLDAKTEKNASAFAWRVHARVDASVKEFRERPAGNASAYARAASANFRPNDDVEALAATAATRRTGGRDGNLDGKSIAGYYKALARIERANRSGRAAVAEAFGALTPRERVERKGAGDGDLDDTRRGERAVVRALSDESARVRDAASGALVNVALACARGCARGVSRW